ncbi:MAG TPA: two-component regulator propeller domain-containing protein [Bacteroidia bacterium]|jgi:hypothetical protein|nr:two-component regulator propeller domain-containing protein [Bacteroidia bacterium]
MKRLYFLVFLILSISSIAQELSFENLQLKLPSTEVHQIIEDAEGFIWIATDAGACKYDGTNLTTYTVKDGLPENVVLRMQMDSKNRIWFNTLSNYFCYFDKGHFVSIAANPVIKNWDKSQTISTNFFVGEKDTLFLSYYGPGFLKIPPKDNYKDILVQRGKFCEGHLFQAIIQNKLKPTELMDCGWFPKFKMDTISYQIFMIDTVVTLSLKGARGDYNRLYNTAKMGNDGTVYMVYRNLVYAVKNRKEIGHYVFSKEIFKLYVDKDGDLWAGVDRDGLYLFKNGDLSKPPLRSLRSLSVSAILLDKEGTLWAGTQEKGIFQCMNKHVYAINEKARDFKIVDKKLTIVLESGKLLTTPATDSVRIEKIPTSLPQESKFIAYAKVKQVEYLGVGNQTFTVKNRKITELFQNIIHPSTNKYFHLGIRHLINLSNDTVLAAGLSNTFIIYDGKLMLKDTTRFAINIVTRLPDERVIVASRSNAGLFERKNKKYIPFLPDVKELKTRINCITVDSAGNFWFASNEKGLFCYDTHQQLHVFNESNGLPSSKVNTCIATPNGEIWCGTYAGLSRLIPSKEIQKTSIVNYDKNHGIADMEIDRLIYFDRGIWCGGKTTLFFFNPENLSKNTQPPPVFIKSIAVSGENFSLRDTLLLNYDQNDFHVQFGLISYKKTPTQSFFYKLNGYDNNWKLSTSGDIQYTNIRYGTYALMVYAINNDGVRSTLPKRLTFIIKRPFWFTWWFITLILILLVFLIYTGAQYWRKKIEKKERDKAAINQQLSEFKMTALRSQMNPHFIYNAIGSIQHYILKNEVDQSFNYLSKFSSLIRKVLNNSKNEYISLEDEISTLKLYIDLEQLRFKHPFRFILDIDKELDMGIDIPTMLIQPYIENSIWHGLMPKESGGKLELILKNVNRAIHVIIRDNGVGREKGDLSSKYHVSKGMSLTEQRIQTLENTSKKKFVTAIIDLKDGQGSPIGTEVNLIIPFDE